jgi:hypothetical protein
MNGMKRYSIGPVKVSEMRQMIQCGQFANWIAVIKKTQKRPQAILEDKDEKVQA